MPDDPSIPIVMYMFRGAPRNWGFGYLVHQDGIYWCFPNEESAKILAFQSGEFQLDQSHLQEQPDKGQDRKLYLYLAEVLVFCHEHLNPLCNGDSLRG